MPSRFEELEQDELNALLAEKSNHSDEEQEGVDEDGRFLRYRVVRPSWRSEKVSIC